MKMKLYNREELFKEIKRVQKWENSDEKRIMLRSLGSLLLQIDFTEEFIEGVRLELREFKIPNKIDRIFHYIGLHHWLYYLDYRVFDCTRRICYICGITEGSPLKKKYAVYERCGNKTLNLNKLKKFIEDMQNV